MNISENLSISEIIECLPGIANAHARTAKIYKILDPLAKYLVQNSGLTDPDGSAISLGNFGEMRFPFTRMGTIDSLDLFGLDELIIFAFYWTNRHRYKRVADIGANLGLHSLLMSRCGWQITSYEPDPIHADLLRRNLQLNNVTTVELVEAAVSDKAGTLEFVRVLGNTTGSHLAGAKSNPYGELVRFPVDVVAIDTVIASADFVKMDVEGQESTIICSITADHWDNTDMIVEVGTEKNARTIFEHLKKFGVNAFAQKLGWQQVQSVNEMPASYKEGSLFITSKSSMPWA